MAENIIRKRPYRVVRPVEDIRRDYAAGVRPKAILERYGITRAVLYRILGGTHWQLRGK